LNIGFDNSIAHERKNASQITLLAIRMAAFRTMCGLQTEVWLGREDTQPAQHQPETPGIVGIAHAGDSRDIHRRVQVGKFRDMVDIRPPRSLRLTLR